mmetsp:Transcript_17620/g.45996  ORF Transcript_17620/g.45996 Transcript_17620/m.45996 type:complete len:470 (+) Transcript_17620:1520-2929(+)
MRRAVTKLCAPSPRSGECIRRFKWAMCARQALVICALGCLSYIYIYTSQLLRLLQHLNPPDARIRPALMVIVRHGCVGDLGRVQVPREGRNDLLLDLRGAFVVPPPHVVERGLGHVDAALPILLIEVRHGHNTVAVQQALLEVVIYAVLRPVVADVERIGAPEGNLFLKIVAQRDLERREGLGLGLGVLTLAELGSGRPAVKLKHGQGGQLGRWCALLWLDHLVLDEGAPRHLVRRDAEEGAEEVARLSDGWGDGETLPGGLLSLRVVRRPAAAEAPREETVELWEHLLGERPVLLLLLRVLLLQVGDGITGEPPAALVIAGGQCHLRAHDRQLGIGLVLDAAAVVLRVQNHARIGVLLRLALILVSTLPVAYALLVLSAREQQAHLSPLLVELLSLWDFDALRQITLAIAFDRCERGFSVLVGLFAHLVEPRVRLPGRVNQLERRLGHPHLELKLDEVGLRDPVGVLL